MSKPNSHWHTANMVLAAFSVLVMCAGFYLADQELKAIGGGGALACLFWWGFRQDDLEPHIDIGWDDDD